jgi:phosphonoacetate hydrolase
MTQTQKSLADQVIIAVFDGLRPDMVTSELTPNIMRLAERGRWFREARSVFPSVTRVATSSIATGATPSIHGIVGNAFYHPAAFPDSILMTSNIDQIRRAETVHGGRFVEADTFGDVLAQSGKKLCVVHTGTAGSAHVINPRARANKHWTFSIHGPDATQTPEAVTNAISRIGPLPERELPRISDVRYAGRLMVDHVLSELKPDVALVWFSEPDTSFHYRDIGSADAKKALTEADAALGGILDWVEAQPHAERIAVIIASDHGQISTRAAHPLFDEARNAGFAVALKDGFADATFVATGGISGEIRLLRGERDNLARIAHWLMDQPEIGHVFASGRNEVEGEIEGTLALGLVGKGHARQADLMFVLKSDRSQDRYGLPGLGLMTPGDVPVGGGMHGGLNPHELNTVLVLALGTEEEPGSILSAPAGIIDIAPTTLDLLGLSKAPSMQGRSLARAAREEPHRKRFSAGTNGFLQHVDIVEQDGRRFILGGGQ